MNQNKFLDGIDLVASECKYTSAMNNIVEDWSGGFWKFGR